MMNIRTGRDGTFLKARYTLQNSHKIVAWTLIIGCGVLSIIWFFLFSGFWNVQNLEIEGLEALDRGEVTSSTFKILDEGRHLSGLKRNIILLNKDGLINELKDKLFLDEVAVDKVYPDILRLKITERQRSVIVASKDQLLSVDTHGVVTGEVDSFLADNAKKRLNNKTLSDFKYPPLILCELQELVASGYQIAKPEIVKNWLDSYKSFISSGLKFRYLILDSIDSRTAKLRMEKGYVVIFDLRSPLEAQIETYRKFVSSDIMQTVINEYIDVRVPGKLYIN